MKGPEVPREVAEKIAKAAEIDATRLANFCQEIQVLVDRARYVSAAAEKLAVSKRRKITGNKLDIRAAEQVSGLAKKLSEELKNITPYFRYTLGRRLQLRDVDGRLKLGNPSLETLEKWIAHLVTASSFEGASLVKLNRKRQVGRRDSIFYFLYSLIEFYGGRVTYGEPSSGNLREIRTLLQPYMPHEFNSVDDRTVWNAMRKHVKTRPINRTD
jgi:hypothetical protein